MPYSLHCTDISGDHVASIINVNEDGNGTGNKVYQTTRLHISKTSAFLCDFLVTECDTLGKPGDVVLHKVRGPHNLSFYRCTALIEYWRYKIL